MMSPLPARNHQPGGSLDYITVFGEDGGEIESIAVESSEDERPYVDALAEAGWTVTGATQDRKHVHGGDAWALAGI